MGRADELLIVTGIAGALSLALMLGVKLISPTRFTQALAGGLVGLGLAKLALVASGGDHG
jgi:hypothetical protein